MERQCKDLETGNVRSTLLVLSMRLVLNQLQLSDRFFAEDCKGSATVVEPTENKHTGSFSKSCCDKSSRDPNVALKI